MIGFQYIEADGACKWQLYVDQENGNGDGDGNESENENVIQQEVGAAEDDASEENEETKDAEIDKIMDEIDNVHREQSDSESEEEPEPLIQQPFVNEQENQGSRTGTVQEQIEEQESSDDDGQVAEEEHGSVEISYDIKGSSMPICASRQLI